MEAECRHYLSVHNRLPPERRKVPEHRALRQFLVCDASVLIDAAGTSTNETEDSVLCLHPDIHRAASVTASFERWMPDVADIDAYEPITENNEDLDINDLFDDPEDESSKEGEDGDLSDAALLASSIAEMEVTLNTGYTVHTRNCVLFPVCKTYLCRFPSSHFRV
jgi:hypothetical protein